MAQCASSRNAHKFKMPALKEAYVQSLMGQRKVSTDSSMLQSILLDASQLNHQSCCSLSLIPGREYWVSERGVPTPHSALRQCYHGESALWHALYLCREKAAWDCRTGTFLLCPMPHYTTKENKGHLPSSHCPLTASAGGQRIVLASH